MNEYTEAKNEIGLFELISSDRWSDAVAIILWQFGFDPLKDIVFHEHKGLKWGKATRNGELVEFLIREIPFDDDNFRWVQGDLNAGFPLTLHISSNYIRMFASQMLYERILANKKHIKYNESKKLFAIKYELVNDLVANKKIKITNTRKG